MLLSVMLCQIHTYNTHMLYSMYNIHCILRCQDLYILTIHVNFELEDLKDVKNAQWASPILQNFPELTSLI